MFLRGSTLLFPSSSDKEWSIYEGKENGESFHPVVILSASVSVIRQALPSRCRVVVGSYSIQKNWEKSRFQRYANLPNEFWFLRKRSLWCTCLCVDNKFVGRSRCWLAGQHEVEGLTEWSTLALCGRWSIEDGLTEPNYRHDATQTHTHTHTHTKLKSWYQIKIDNNNNNNNNKRQWSTYWFLLWRRIYSPRGNLCWKYTCRRKVRLWYQNDLLVSCLPGRHRTNQTGSGSNKQIQCFIQQRSCLFFVVVVGDGGGGGGEVVGFGPVRRSVVATS